LLGLWESFLEKRNANYDEELSIVNFNQNPLSPDLNFNFRLKKGGKIDFILSSLWSFPEQQDCYGKAYDDQQGDAYH